MTVDEAEAQAQLSTIERVNYRGKETRTHILTADNASVYRNAETGELCIALHRYGEGARNEGKAIETYEFRLCELDVRRLKGELVSRM